VQPIGAQLIAGFRKLKLQKMDTWSCMIYRRSGRSASATSTDILNRSDAIIRTDRRITSQQLALLLSVSKGSAITIIKTNIQRFALDGFLGA
jgi:hypothetical protein